MSIWTRWNDARPEDPTKFYRWRAGVFDLLGMKLCPEWSEKMSRCGMGYGEPEYWPLSACHWDGRSRYPHSPYLEWREATPEEADARAPILWGGLDLLPCPFSGRTPRVGYSGRYIGAPPYHADSLYISNWMGGLDHYWNNAAKMQARWNTRA